MYLAHAQKQFSKLAGFSFFCRYLNRGHGRLAVDRETKIEIGYKFRPDASHFAS